MEMDWPLDGSISALVQGGFDIDVLNGSHYKVVSAIKWFQGTRP